MLGRILAVDAVDRTALENDRVKRELAEIGMRWRRRAWRPNSSGSSSKEEHGCTPRWPCGGPSSAPTTAAAGATVRALVEPDMRVPGDPYAIDRVDPAAQLGHHRHGQARRPPLFQQAAAAAHAHGRRILADLSPHRLVAGHAALRDRPLHAGHVQRDSAADLLLLLAAAGRAVGHDRLGPDFRHGRRPSSAPS